MVPVSHMKMGHGQSYYSIASMDIMTKLIMQCHHYTDQCLYENLVQYLLLSNWHFPMMTAIIITYCEL